MDDLWKAIVLGVVEGVTEFLPVSSTGHLLLCQRWMGIDLKHDLRWQTFAIFIQIGAILAVVVYFRHRILELLRGQPEGRRTPLEISVSARASTGAAVTVGPAATAAGPDAAHAATGGNGEPDAPGVPTTPVRSRVREYHPDIDGDLVTAAERGHAILMILLAT